MKIIKEFIGGMKKERHTRTQTWGVSETERVEYTCINSCVYVRI